MFRKWLAVRGAESGGLGQGEEVALACPRVLRVLTPSPQVIYRKPFLAMQHKQGRETVVSLFVHQQIKREVVEETTSSFFSQIY